MLQIPIYAKLNMCNIEYMQIPIYAILNIYNVANSNICKIEYMQIPIIYGICNIWKLQYFSKLLLTLKRKNCFFFWKNF